MEYLYGRNSVRAAIYNGSRVISLLIQENLLKDNEIQQIIKEAQKRGIPWQKGSKIELSNLLGNTNHQGILARAESYKYKSFKAEIDRLKSLRKSIVIILDHLYDPQNLGAILRSAHAFDVDLVIIPKERAAGITPATARVSAGSSELISICREPNINQVIQELKDNDFWIYGADSRLGQNCREIEYDRKTALVLGSERKGLSKLVRDNCDFLIRIPINKEVDSLNVGAATSVILYEIRGKKR